jgi:thymidine kinase
MPRLLAHADDADKLHAICQICAGPATMTQRLVDGRPAHRDDPVILIGASERYEARCRGCHRLADAVLPLVATG